MVAEISRFFYFSRWWPSTITDLFAAFLDHPQNIFGGLYWCAEFGWNLCGKFNYMKFWIFCTFGLKMPFHAPKIMVCGYLTYKMCRYINRTPKRHMPAWKDIIWHINHQNWSTCATYACVESNTFLLRNMPLKPMETRNPGHSPSPWARGPPVIYPYCDRPHSPL